MSDWKLYKGEGPWTFTKSPPKNYYNEGSHISSKDNPVWDLDRILPDTPITIEHNPHCGYWPNLNPTIPTPEPGGSANLFGLFEAGALIYGLYWDGISSLTYTGLYDPNDGEPIYNLLLDTTDDTIITVAGNNTTSVLRKIETTPVAEVFPLNSELDVFNDYDATQTVRSQLVRNSDDDVVYYIDGAQSANPIGTGGRLVELDGTTYAKQRRSFIGTVFTGTDSNLYLADSFFSAWNAQKRPITGAYHADFFSYIPDQQIDITPGVWGVGSLYHAHATEFRAMYWDSQIWTLQASASPQMRKHWPSSLGILGGIGTISYGYDFVGYDEHVYVVEGAFSCTLRKYTNGYMVLVDELILTPGRADEIIEMNGSLIVLNDPYTDYNVLFKVNPSTMTVIDQYDFPSGELWQRIAAIDDRYLFIGGNNEAMVFDIINWTIVDTVSLVSLAGYNTRDVLVQNL